MSSAHERFKDSMSENFAGLWREKRLPASELIGLEVLDFDHSKLSIRTKFLAASHLFNAMGFVQGGILGAMFDDTLSLAGTVASNFTKLMLTHEMKLCFIQPASPGLIFGEGRVAHLGKSLAFLEGELRSKDGMLWTTATTSARPFSF